MDFAGLIVGLVEKPDGLDITVTARGTAGASAPITQMAADIARAWVSRDCAGASAHDLLSALRELTDEVKVLRAHADARAAAQARLIEAGLAESETYRRHVG